MSRVDRGRSILRRRGVRGLADAAADHLRWRLRTSDTLAPLRGWRYARRGGGVDPLARHAVDPDRIRYVVGGVEPTPPGSYHLQRVAGFDHRVDGLGAVRGGAWDRTTDRFADLLVYRSMRARLEGADWSETALYRRHRERIADGHASYGCRDVDALEARLGAVDRLTERIRSEGYRPRREAGGDPFDEVRVAIGRDGELRYNDEGRHRLAAAKLLDVEAVPVYVVARHEELVYP